MRAIFLDGQSTASYSKNDGVSAIKEEDELIVMGFPQE